MSKGDKLRKGADLKAYRASELWANMSKPKLCREGVHVLNKGYCDICKLKGDTTICRKIVVQARDAQ